MQASSSSHTSCGDISIHLGFAVTLHLIIMNATTHQVEYVTDVGFADVNGAISVSWRHSSSASKSTPEVHCCAVSVLCRAIVQRDVNLVKKYVHDQFLRLRLGKSLLQLQASFCFPPTGLDDAHPWLLPALCGSLIW